MIRFLEKNDKDAVISLWQEAFGDKSEEISVFLDFFNENLLVFEEDGQIVSMLTLIKTEIDGKKGRYIYAVATDKRFRGMGYASRLIEFAKQFISENDEKFLVLVPRNKPLFDFYKRQGFCELSCAETIKKKISFKENTDLKTEIIDAKEYFYLRNAYFSGEKYAVWDINMLEFIKNAYKGDFFALKKNHILCGTGFCYKQGDLLVISELLEKEKSDEIIDTMGTFFGVKEVFCIKAQKYGERFAMIYPKEFCDAYFGLAMK